MNPHIKKIISTLILFGFIFGELTLPIHLWNLNVPTNLRFSQNIAYAALPAPGGYDTNLNQWYKADLGYTYVSTTEGTWADQSGNGYDLTADTVLGPPNAPELFENTLNFNPTVDFSGTDDALAFNFDGTTSTYPTGDVSTFTVLQVPVEQQSNSTLWHYSDGGNNQHAFFHTANSTNSSLALNNIVQTIPSDFDDNIPRILTTVSNSTTPQTNVYNNGENVFTTATVSATAGDGCYGLGYDQDSSECNDGNNHLDGAIAEMIVYDEALSDTNKQKVETYLALKYSISTDQSTATTDDGSGDYLSSNNTIIFDAHDGISQNPYNQFIFGIGKDINSSLDQQISKSGDPNSLLTISTDSNFTDPNGTHTSLSDGQYLLLSSNGSPHSLQTTELDTGTYTNRLTREWQAHNTNSVTGINLKFDTFGSSTARTSYLLEDIDGDFSTTNDQTEIGTLDSDGTIENVNMNDGAYYTLATITAAPGGVFNNLTAWYNNSNYEFINDNESSWYDISNNSYHLTADQVAGVTSSAPGLALNTLNFNTALEFGDNGGIDDGLAYDFAAGGYPTNNKTIFQILNLQEETRTSGGTMIHYSDGGENTEAIFTVPNENNTEISTNDVFEDTFINFDDNITHISTFEVNTATPETSLSKDGSIDFTTTSVATPTGTGCFGVGYDQDPGPTCNDGNNHLLGFVGELIIYDEVLSPTEKRKVESYLAIKYGITLDQTSAITDDGNGDYIASDGTIIFDAHDGTSQNPYNQNITVIGQDSISGLDQQISKSAISDFLTISTDTNFTNANGTHTPLSDGQFLAIGSDGNSIAYQNTELDTTTYTERIGREWKVNNIGNVGPINLKFDGLTNSGMIVNYLVQDTDGDFSTTGDQTQIGPLDNNGEINNITLQDEQHYTVATIDTNTYPAGINDLTVWLDANQGYTFTSSVDATWLGKSPNPLLFDSKIVGGTPDDAPELESESINFNNTVRWTGTDTDDALAHDFDGINSSYPTSDRTIITVMQADPAPSGENAVWSYANGGDLSNGQNAEVLFNTDSNTESGLFLNNTSGFINTNLDDGIVNISTYRVDDINTETTFFKNNLLQDTLPVAASTDNDGCLGIGFDQDASNCNDGENHLNESNGQIAEFLIFDKALSPTEQQKVESYLALKYGVQLDQTQVSTNNGAGDYLSSQNTVIFDAHDGTNPNPFNNDIFGIGRDDKSDLGQIISKSSQPEQVLTILAEGENTTDNNFKPNRNYTDLDDNEFLLIANNNSSSSWTATNAPTGFQILERKWKAQETGEVGTIQLDLNTENTNFNIPELLGGTEYFLVIDTDNDEDFSDETPTAMSDQGSDTWRSSSTNMDNNQFTFATSEPVIKGAAGVDDNIAYWYKADDSYNYVSPTEATWADSSGNGFSLTADAVPGPSAPEIGTQEINFNPTLSFDGADDALGINYGPGEYPTGDVSTFMVMQAPPDESLNGIMWIYTDGGNEEQTVLLDAGQDNTFITFDNTFFATNINSDDNIPHILSTVSDSAVNQGRFYKDGFNGFTAADSSNAGGAGCLTLGLDQGSAECNDGNFQYLGNIAELIFYGDTITEPERARIESYLALKYGISKDQSNVTTDNGDGDYVDSNGTPIYNAHDGANPNPFNSEIFGIGRDDTAEHAQIKSKSSNPNGILTILAEGESSSNDNNPSNLSLTDIQNQEFLMISNNDGLASWTDTNSPAGFQILDKKWISDETGDVGTIQIDLDVADPDFDLPNLIEGTQYYIIQDTDNDGEFSDETPTSMSDQGSNTWRASSVDMNENQFTFATQSNPTIEFSSAAFSDEESDGANLPTLLVTGNLSSNTNIDIQILDSSTATLGTDFDIASLTPPLPKTFTVVIPSGNYTQASFALNSLNLSGGGTPNFTINDDIDIEVDETISLQLTNPQNNLVIGDTGNGDNITTASTTYTITDDENTTVSITATDDTAIENSANTGEFTVSIDDGSTNQTGNSITVNYSIDPSSTATSGSDFVALSGSVNIPNTASSATILINTTLDDAILEGDETLTLTVDSISNSGSSSLNPAAPPNDEATVTIQDDEVSDPGITSIVRQNPSTTPTNSNTVTFRVTFTEDVNNVDSTDFELTEGGTVSANINTTNQITTRIYDIVINSITGDGTLNLDVASGNNIQGTTGTPYNGNIATEEEYTIDNTPPNVTIDQASTQPDPTNIDSATFTVVFNEPINPATFTASDVNILNSTGTVTSGPTEVAPNDDTTFQFTITGMTSGDTVSVTLPSGRISDIAGNTNLNSTSTDNSVTYTTDAPDILSINRHNPTSPITNANTVVFRVTFSEAVFDVTDDDFEADTTGTVTTNSPTVNSINSSVYDVTFTSIVGDGNLNLNIEAGNNITNIAGNNLSNIIGSEQEYVIDNTAPDTTATLSTPTVSNNSNENIVGSCGIDAANGTVQVTTDPANGFTTNYNTSLSLDGSGDFTISNPDWSDGTYQIFFQCTDQAGNGPITSSAQGPVTIDTAFPTVTINQAGTQTDPTNDPNIEFIAVFSLPINTSTFITSDIDTSTSTSTGITIDSITEIAPNDGTTFQINTTGGTDGTIILTIPENTVQTPTGNNNFASTSTDNSVTLDTVAPTPVTPSTPQTNLVYMDTPITGSCGIGAANGIAEITTSPINGFTSNYNTQINLNANGDYNIASPNWEEGTFDLIVNCIDQATNNATTTVSNFTIDSTAPNSPTVNPINNNIILGLTTTLTGSCEIGSSVNISAPEIIGSPINTSCNGTSDYSQTITFASETENPVITINQTDAGGNISASATIQPDIDQDSDGIISSVENSAPNVGDNNNDGTLDSLQSNVTSLISPITGNFQTIEALNTCNNLISTEIINENTLSVQDTNFAYPLGLTSSQINCINPADSSDIRVIFDQVYDTTVWRFKTYIPSLNTYSDITDDVTYTTFDNNGVPVTTVNYTATDGNVLTDQDLSENNQILVFSGPATQTEIIVANPPSSNGSSSGSSSFSSPFSNQPTQSGNSSSTPGNSNSIDGSRSCSSKSFETTPISIDPNSYQDLENIPQNEKDLILYLLERAIISGQNNSANLDINTLINRAELSKILSISRGDQIKICSDQKSFPDVFQDQWFFDFIINMEDKNIVNGYPNGEFKPSQNITYAEAYKMIALAFEITSQKEASTISQSNNLQWYIPYKEILSQLEINQNFINADPSEAITRREIFTILSQILQLQS